MQVGCLRGELTAGAILGGGGMPAILHRLLGKTNIERDSDSNLDLEVYLGCGGMTECGAGG